MLSNWNHISSSVHLQPKDYLTRNFYYVEENGPIYGYMMKIDDTYTDARVRWNSADNELYGFCYQHAAGKDTFLAVIITLTALHRSLGPATYTFLKNRWL